jgi:sensor histidine kinase YesM
MCVNSRNVLYHNQNVHRITPFLISNADFSQHIGSDVFQIIHISVETVWTIIFFFTFILFLFCFYFVFVGQKTRKKYYNFIKIN